MLYPKDKILPGKDYYALSFLASEQGRIHLSGQTMWVGYYQFDRKIELRQFSTVHADRMADFWTKCEMPFCVVNNQSDYVIWFVSGGHALVEKSVAFRMLPESMQPSPSIILGAEDEGFTGIDIVPEAVFKKAPTPKKRMEVLKRDRFRCKICGRSPENYVDIELHVHHIRPVGEGGLTHERNLITLCDTCHKGLVPTCINS